MPRPWTLALLLILLPTLAAAQPAAQPAVEPPPEYAAAVQALDRFLAREVAAKRLPALSIALVDDQKTVWAKGYGFADAAKTQPATADTVHRVGSVSKLLTDLAVMQRVEQGRLDLDAPVTKYLPDFKPLSRFTTPITLRHLMAHRAGLVREPPEGNYFDPSVTSLERTVRSLNRTELLHEPGTKTKYSNAGLAVVGRVLEVTEGQRFARHLHNRVLAPLGMTKSAFEPAPALNADLAAAVMGTYHGRDFPAPTFELGMVPAGSMYSTVNDLARFLSALFAGGKGPGGPVVEAKTLQDMWTPQFAKPGEKTGFGLGFSLAEFEGRRSVGHGGAMYGFATSLQALPDDRLGVVVIAARDAANGVTRHAAHEALRHMLAVRAKKPLPTIEETRPVDPERARQLAGRYATPDGQGYELTERDGRLYMLPLAGGAFTELRARGDDLVTDDLFSYGQKFTVKDDKLTVGSDTFPRQPPVPPKPLPEKWRGLVGEYGWDHNVLYILEKDGRLWALIEWFEYDPLEPESDDVFRFPAGTGMYHGEKIVFTRDAKGRAIRAAAAGIAFERRPTGDDGATFKITPRRPVADLRRDAARAAPPVEKGYLQAPDLVDVTAHDPSIRVDLRYATDNNFLGAPLYPSTARPCLQRPAAEALVRVHRALEKEGYGLLIHDAYRPWSVTWVFWEATPPPLRGFVANPAGGSRHNRGCAVDLTLFDRKTGKAVVMPSGYDEMTDRAYPHYPGGTSEQRRLRDLLGRAMSAEGFKVFEAEWWHFDYKDWKRYPVLNASFEDLAKSAGRP